MSLQALIVLSGLNRKNASAACRLLLRFNQFSLRCLVSSPFLSRKRLQQRATQVQAMRKPALNFCRLRHIFDNLCHPEISCVVWSICAQGMKRTLIQSVFLSHLDEIVRERGGDINHLLKLAGLSTSVLREESSLVPFTFHSRLLDIAAEQIDMPELGMSLAARQSVEFLGPLHALVSQEKTLRLALNVFCQQLKLQVHAVDASVEEHENYAVFVLRNSMPVIESSVRYQDHAVALAYNLLKWLSPLNWKPRAVYFPRPPPKNFDPYTHFFKAPLCFDSEQLCISFDQELLDSPIAPDAHQIPEKLRLLLDEKNNLDVTSQVQFLIESLITSNSCNTSHIADMLGLTRRTLQRRLKNEGTSFQILLDQKRASLAKSYILHSHYHFGDIAVMLGFADQACFTRSFERWFDMTPSAWRKQYKNA